MSEDNVTIKIGGDPKGFKDALTESVVSAEYFQETLKKLTEISEKAFEGLVDQIKDSVKAFEDSDTASRALSGALQNQGIYTDDLKESYLQYAESVSKLTGLSNTQILQAQTVAQTYLGNIPITEKLTKAIADLAVGQGVDLKTAALEMSKAIGNGTGMLLRQGLAFDTADTAGQRLSKTLDFVSVKYADAATNINPLALAQNKLHTAIEANNEALGARFAPLLAVATSALTDLLTPTEENAEAAADLKAGLIAAGLAVTSLGVAIPILAQAWIALKTAVALFNIELTATKTILAGLGIGLLILALTELVLHWKQVSQTIIAIVKNMVGFISEAFAGLKEIITGALELDGDKIKAGLAQIKDAFISIKDDAVEAWTGATEAAHTGATEQIETKRVLASKLRAQADAQKDAEIALEKAKGELVNLELENASKKQLVLKQKEIKDLEQLTKTHNATQQGILKEHIAKLLDQQSKYGETYKAINKVINSDEVQGTKQATGDLIQLTQSKNETLKTIGKAAAVANVVIKTAESAMNIFEGFSIIPFIGPALGVAGAAAAIAFGAEQIGNITAAASGGIVTGGIPGIDSVPALLTPGELVVPTRNYEEVVSSVASNRNNTSQSGEPGTAVIQLQFNEDFGKVVEASIVRQQRLGVSILKKVT